MRKRRLNQIARTIANALDQEDNVRVVVATEADAAELIARMVELHPEEFSNSGELSFQVILTGEGGGA